MRALLVVNPTATTATRRGRDVLARALGSDLKLDVVETERRSHAILLGEMAVDQAYDVVVVLGGDGTVNEVVNGFFDDGKPIAPDASFALIPYGTGGDFRRTLELPVATASAAALVAQNYRKKIDVGMLDFTTRDGKRVRRMFANIASFGVSGVVDRLVNESGKKLGRLSFMLATARATWSYKNQRVQLIFDGTERAELTINTVAVANGKYFGGAMMVAPDAEVDDGAFDVVAMGDFTFGDLVKSGQRLYKGTHLTMDKVSVRRAKVVEAAPVEPGAIVELDVDGECPGKLPARFAIVPAALWMVVPGS